MKKVLHITIVGIMLTLPLLFPVLATAEDVFDDVCSGVSGSTVCDSNWNQGVDENGLYGPDGVLTKTAQILALVIAVTSVVIIIISGMQFILSTGDPAKVNKARNAIIFALVGLVIAGLAQAIIVFVIGRL